ncbi:tetratricopeptide repeat protein [Emticicia fluvialis]|uniref:tetratricopeptide repeat protein n=1 Tax=Emticicia fluvialis TaxID=2974474 RepID=UPI002165F8D0|nr:tetratricopeptide repeat protein [Emticicia fluvialis]
MLIRHQHFATINRFFSGLLWLLVFAIPAYATTADFTPNLQKAYAEIFKLRMQSGRNLLATESPANPFRVYVENYADMVELLNSEDAAAFEKLTGKEEQRLALIEQTDRRSPYNRFLRAELKIHWALLKIRFGHEIKAAWNIIQANKLLEENRKLFPEFLPNLKSIGCLHVLVGSIPENQQWVTNFLGLKGNIQQGIKELEAASKDKIWGGEADFCRFFIQAYILPYTDQANEELLQAVNHHKDNLNLCYLATAISLKTGQTDQAAEILRLNPYNASYLYFPIAELYKAEINLFKGNYAQASAAYMAYIRNFKGKTFLKDTYYKLFLSNWLAGDEKKSLAYLRRIPDVGNTVAESDKAAQKFYESYNKTQTFPDKRLMRIRLAFDAGYYDEALHEAANLSETSFGSAKDKADFNYRIARIFHKTAQPDKALAYYERAIKLTDQNKDSQWHFGASAALQAGYIFQERNQPQKAKVYFEKALAYKRHEYKTSIDNKARAALTALGF